MVLVPRAVMFLDPDTKNSAVAVGTAKRILAVGVANNKTKSMEGKAAIKHKLAEQCDALHALTCLVLKEFPQVDLCVSEFPRDYGRNRWANPNDLIALSAVIGSFMGPAGPRGVLVFPSEWKGNMNKRICQARAFEHYGWEFTEGDSKEGVRRFRIPEAVQVLTEIPQPAMGDLADAVAGAKWASLFGRRRAGT